MTIHYHGADINPGRHLLEMAGAHFCVSHFYPGPVRTAHEIGQSVMLDNGAFSAWKLGRPVADWRPYYDWCDRWLDYPTTWAVIPDVITGDEGDNDLLVRAWPHGDRGAPVWHMHESLSRLVALIDTFPRICIGSSAQFAEVMGDSWQRRMDEAWREIGRHFRRTPNVHMLRGLRLVRERWPFASVDSTDIARNHNRAENTPAKMKARWDAAQCPPSFTCRGEQLEFAA